MTFNQSKPFEGNFPPPLPFEAKFIDITIHKGDVQYSTPLSLEKLPERKSSATANDEARIFVIECSNPQVPEIADISPEFVDGHLRDGDELQSTVYQQFEDGFFARWSRLVTQSQERYEDEQRIRAKKPYDVDTPKDWDPADLLIDHSRCYRWPEYPSRAYDLVLQDTSKDKPKLFHAAKECMSFFSTKVDEKFIGTKRLFSLKSHG